MTCNDTKQNVLLSWHDIVHYYWRFINSEAMTYRIVKYITQNIITNLCVLSKQYIFHPEQHKEVWTEHKINNWYICKTCKLTNSVIRISFSYLEQSIYTLSMCLDKVIIIIIHIFGPNLTTSNTCLCHTWFRQIDLLEISPFQIFTQ